MSESELGVEVGPCVLGHLVLKQHLHDVLDLRVRYSLQIVMVGLSVRVSSGLGDLESPICSEVPTVVGVIVITICGISVPAPFVTKVLLGDVAPVVVVSDYVYALR